MKYVLSELKQNSMFQKFSVAMYLQKHLQALHITNISTNLQDFSKLYQFNKGSKQRTNPAPRNFNTWYKSHFLHTSTDSNNVRYTRIVKNKQKPSSADNLVITVYSPYCNIWHADIQENDHIVYNSACY